jgi:TatD DNase family protein
MEDSYFTIDIGCNFAGNKYTNDKLSKIIKESYDYGVDKIISISNSLKEIPRNKEISEMFDNVYYVAGVHPHNAKMINKISDLEILEKYKDDKKMVAIGEIGLDYNRMFSPKENQIEVFKEQIKIAKKMNKPIYLHCRDAFDDFIEVLKSEGYYNGVIHTFTGTKEEAKVLLEMGFYFGITGWLLDNRRNADLKEAIKIIPIEKIMVETDAPFLSIDRKRESLPYDTGVIVEEISKIKKIDMIKIGKQIYENSKKFFKIN